MQKNELEAENCRLRKRLEEVSRLQSEALNQKIELQVENKKLKALLEANPYALTVQDYQRQVENLKEQLSICKITIDNFSKVKDSFLIFSNSMSEIFDTIENKKAENPTLNQILRENTYLGRQCIITGTVVKSEIKMTQYDKPYISLVFKDYGGEESFSLFGSDYEKYKNAFKEGDNIKIHCIPQANSVKSYGNKLKILEIENI